LQICQGELTEELKQFSVQKGIVLSKILEVAILKRQHGLINSNEI
jgi:hypothetical protein